MILSFKNSTYSLSILQLFPFLPPTYEYVRAARPPASKVFGSVNGTICLGCPSQFITGVHFSVPLFFTLASLSLPSSAHIQLLSYVQSGELKKGGRADMPPPLSETKMCRHLSLGMGSLFEHVLLSLLPNKFWKKEKKTWRAKEPLFYVRSWYNLLERKPTI